MPEFSDALEINGASERSIFDTELLANLCEIEQKYGVSYDSVIAPSALQLNGGILSDDESFDKLPSIVKTTV